MDKYDLRDLLDYAKRFKLLKHPFIEVFNRYYEELKEAYDDTEADYS